MDQSHSTNEATPRKRRRAKVACEPCRLRKRKCDSRQPCNTCVEFEYECYYAPSKSKAKSSSGVAQQQESQLAGSPVSSEPAPLAGTAATAPTGGNDNHDSHETAKEKAYGGSSAANARTHMQSLEANSGAAFVRRLGLKIDPYNAPQLHLFAWNAGERLAGCAPGTARRVTTILPQAQMRSLALVFFEKVAIGYGFIDRDVFFERLGERWQTPAMPDSYDCVLCGVAALGLHFSQRVPPVYEPDLVETAKTLLEQGSLVTPPSINIVTGWVLRVAYLRMTSLPHAAWLASCSLMHVAESANIHLEAPSHTVFDGSSEVIDLDIRRRLWGMAQHLNIWASFDLGRTKITLPGASTKPVSPKAGDYTSQLLGFIPLTEPLHPNKSRSVEELEADMKRVLDDVLEAPPVVMAQVNLMLCIFRRLRAEKSNMINMRMERILELAMKGLRAAENMVASNSPWHHSANVPFQVVCLLLAIDSRASLALLPDAMNVLQEVTNSWNSAVMREAYNTAYLFILLHQRRKEEDAKTLRNVLGMHSTAPAATTADDSMMQFGGVGDFQQPATDSVEFSWLEDLISDMPSLREFDLEQFLVQDAMQQQDLGMDSSGNYTLL
jgi:hypothetical protein